jgi:3-dehydroquinate dehydratase/shikimate dehydrogenase
VTEVVASIAARDPESSARRSADAAAAGADWIELRLDAWPAGADLGPVLAAAPRPVLVTCRLPRDGGSFPGTAAERLGLLRAALAAGARGIDLEDWEEWVPAPRPPRVIRSLHARAGPPADLARSRDALLARGADIAKIAVRVADLADAGPLLRLVADTDQRRAPTVAFALDEIGAPTRVLAACLGAPLVYACVAAGEETAPGQPTAAELIRLYRVAERGARTAFCGVLGAAARRSLGPLVHNGAFARLGVDAVYLAVETARPEEVVAMLPRDPWRGLSVTSPYKERMLAACASLDAAARECRAVNTLCRREDGRLAGHNTDVIGVGFALAKGGVALTGGEAAAVLGGGGAARAAARALERLGAAVTVLARNPGPSLRACAAVRGWTVAPFAAAVLRELRPRVVVHATPVGADGGERVLPEWTPAPGTAVLDMVYRPARTRLLEDARAAGAIALSGVDMFLGQAAAQVELFTGQRLSAADLAELLP